MVVRERAGEFRGRPPEPRRGRHAGRARAGVVVLGAGAVPLLGRADARRLVDVAASGERRGLTNNRYSSDVCAVGDARVLGDLPALPGDNALPRWLAERAGIPVAELPGRDRLALDLDTPLDLAILALARGTPPALRRLAAEERLEVPRLAELRALLGDPRRELLVFGRGSSRGMALLERRARCRVRFLAEERGLRASSAARPGPGAAWHGRSTPARHAGAAARGARRPRRAGRHGRPSSPTGRSWTAASCWPTGWAPTRPLALPGGPLRQRPPAPGGHPRIPGCAELTASAAGAAIPILLGGHTLVGPGLGVLAGAGRVGRARLTGPRSQRATIECRCGQHAGSTVPSVADARPDVST